MKRDWKVVRLVLEQAEIGDLPGYARRGNFPPELKIDEDTFLGHVELLADAGVLRNVEMIRDMNGRVIQFRMNGVFISMSGHDLLDALRDESVWHRLLDKASCAGVSISWEFIKAAIPVIMKELVA